MTQPYNVLIIGAGQMGAFYDTPDSSDVLSHAHAFSASPFFHLLGFVDAVPEQAEKAASLWGGRAYASIQAAFESNSVDVVCVGTPTTSHDSILREVVQYPMRVVLAEKPMTRSVADATAIASVYQEQGVGLAVNYCRRYLPGFVDLGKRIAAGEFGAFVSGTCRYGKGFLNNGSHHLNLIQSWLGEFRPVAVSGIVHDYWEDDPSMTVRLENHSGSLLTLEAVDCRLYRIFEFDWLFEQGRVRMLEDGCQLEIYGYDEVGKTLVLRETIETQLMRAMVSVADNMAAFLAHGEPLACNADDAIGVLEICEKTTGLSPLLTR